MENRQWNDVCGYEGFYSVSDDGQVWSHHSNRLLKQYPSEEGYLFVHLSKYGKAKRISVHRLVALAFIENPENKPTVNHINEDKTDNRVGNLEWATMREQNIHGTRIERARSHTDYKNRGIDYSVVASKHDYYNLNNEQKKPVLQYDMNGIFLAKFNGISEAARFLGIRPSHICCCLKGRRKSCGGYKWKYAV